MARFFPIVEASGGIVAPVAPSVIAGSRARRYRLGVHAMGIAGVTLVLWLAVGAALGGEAPGTPSIAYDDGRLTVRLAGVPLDDVLDAVASETGIEIQGEIRDHRSVSKRFDAVPLPEALDRLLGNQNFLLTYEADGRPARLRLLGVPQPPLDATARPVTILTLSQLVMDHPPVAVSRRLATVIGSPHASLSQLLIAARRAENPILRAEARALFVASIEKGRSLRDAFRRVDEGVLARFAQRRAGSRAHELLRHVAAGARDPEIRRRATRALDRLPRTTLGRGNAYRRPGPPLARLSRRGDPAGG
jgi:hypothetical protein